MQPIRSQIVIKNTAQIEVKILIKTVIFMKIEAVTIKPR